MKIAKYWESPRRDLIQVKPKKCNRCKKNKLEFIGLVCVDCITKC